MAFERGRPATGLRDVEFERQLASARSGCPEALGQLLQACRRFLLMTANRELESSLRPKQGASDLVQETFFAAQRDFQSFRGTTAGELRGWLGRVLQNQFTHHVRYYKHTHKRTIRREVLLDVANYGRLAEERESPGDAACVADEKRRVRVAMEHLSIDYRQVLTLRTWQGLPFSEIGCKLNRSAEAAEKLWLRAVLRLQQELRNIT